MGNILNEDFVDFLNALNTSEVEYLLVGGYAVIFHGYNRTTGDLDIWVKQTSKNYLKLSSAFSIFGLSLFDMDEVKFLDKRDFDVFTFGRPPVSIDIITNIKGLEFDNAYQSSMETLFDNVKVRMIDLRDLKKAKRASGRPKDIDDLDHLG